MSVNVVKSNLRDYSFEFVSSNEFLPLIDKKFKNRIYIIDENVWRLYEKTLLGDLDDNLIIVLPVDEEKKCIETVIKIYDNLISHAAKRNMTMISIGGGIVQDITGFAASTIYRGINWVFVPTTLLAQADSCIGSKTSLNYKSYKNLIGTFYPPSEIFIYPEFLKTQEDVDYFSGLGEVIKLHIMAGKDAATWIIDVLPELFRKKNDVLRDAIGRSLLIKKEYIEGDEFDSGRRNLLNYGHCFGHAIETVSDFEIPHGQAVVIGMILANIVAVRRGVLKDGTGRFILRDLLIPSLKVSLRSCFFVYDDIIKAMKKDKKRSGSDLALVMLADNYRMVRVDDLKSDEAQAALKELVSVLKIDD